MSDYLAALILGVVQGLTEFLPISSSGHLVLTHHFVDYRAGDIVFDLLLHLATLVAVLLVFGGDLWKLLQGTTSKEAVQRRSSWRMLLFLVMATVPAAIVGLSFGDSIEAVFSSPKLVGGLLMINGLVLCLPFVTKVQGERSMADIPWLHALAIGVAQSFALLPGVSRSGSTITAGLLLKLAPQDAARFSFLLFIPAVLGAVVLKLKDVQWVEMTSDIGALLIAFVAAFVTGYMALRWLLRLLKRGKFHYFGIYCFIVGALILFI